MEKAVFYAEQIPRYKKIVERLNEENIPYTLNNNASILNHEAVNPLYKLIKYFVFHNFVYFLEFMRSHLIGCLNDHVGYLLENKLKNRRVYEGWKK